LYELFTGKRVFEARSINELIALHEKSEPATPSSHVKDIDPLAERVILRCLEKEPKRRPASAVQVALALPGGDPLQAALAMGETPSPEMVAAAGEKTGLRPAVAVACLAAIIVGLFLSVWLGSKVNLIERVPLDTPDALARKAREISAQLGYTDRPADSVWEFVYNYDYLRHVEENDPSPARWHHIQPQAVLFKYRESQQYFQLISAIDRKDSILILQSPIMSGMVDVTLDPQGRLLWFSAAPTPSDQSVAAPDWVMLFRLAGLDPLRFAAEEPIWTPPVAFDARAAWTGSAADQPDTPLRIEASAWRGKPVYFKITYPWTPQTQSEFSQLRGLPVYYGLILLIIVVLVARSNQRRGRGDRHGTFCGETAGRLTEQLATE
jgi:serine/threonine-protein kinase